MEQLLLFASCWLHTALYTNKFIWVREQYSYTPKRFDGNNFLLSRRSRVEHMKSEKCQSCFLRQKFTLWFTFLQVKQVDLLRLMSLALTLATSPLEDYPLAVSREINKSRIMKRSTCGKSSWVVVFTTDQFVWHFALHPQIELQKKIRKSGIQRVKVVHQQKIKGEIKISYLVYSQVGLVTVLKTTKTCTAKR